jgi:hypothetical protein
VKPMPSTPNTSTSRGSGSCRRTHARRIRVSGGEGRPDPDQLQRRAQSRSTDAAAGLHRLHQGVTRRQRVSGRAAMHPRRRGMCTTGVAQLDELAHRQGGASCTHTDAGAATRNPRRTPVLVSSRAADGPAPPRPSVLAARRARRRRSLRRRDAAAAAEAADPRSPPP